jgi:RNA polymerase sigma-70 factor (ECF subfamily)
MIELFDRPGASCVDEERDAMVRPAVADTDDEAKLVAGARRGEARCFEALMNRYERKIFRLAKNLTQNDSDAEDVMQEAFLKAFEHLGEFQGNSRFYTWLVRITINQGLMKLRKRRTNHVSLDEPIETEEHSLPREIEDWGPSPEELSVMLSAAIADLHPALRVVFQLRDIEDLSIKETAKLLGISVSAVKSRLLRARLKLREKLNRFLRKGDRYSKMAFFGAADVVVGRKQMISWMRLNAAR